MTPCCSEMHTFQERCIDSDLPRSLGVGNPITAALQSRPTGAAGADRKQCVGPRPALRAVKDRLAGARVMSDCIGYDLLILVYTVLYTAELCSGIPT
jgi:hypothetical protein